MSFCQNFRIGNFLQGVICILSPITWYGTALKLFMCTLPRLFFYTWACWFSRALTEGWHIKQIPQVFPSFLFKTVIYGSKLLPNYVFLIGTLTDTSTPNAIFVYIRVAQQLNPGPGRTQTGFLFQNNQAAHNKTTINPKE